jgi:hypothetical protein
MVQSTEELLSYLREQAIVKTSEMDASAFTLSALCKIEARFKPSARDPSYSDLLVLAQTTGAGSCWCYGEDPELPGGLLGRDARTVRTGSRCLDIAVLDAIYSKLSQEAAASSWLSGTPEQKSDARASIIVSEISRMIKESELEYPTITMVGAVGSILARLAGLSGRVYATDLDPALVGEKLGGVLVEDGHSRTLERVSQSGLVLLTGMTLATDTMMEVYSAARQNGTKTVVFSQTGSNFGSELIYLGISCVVAEAFPFYMFPGISQIKVFRS